MWKKTLVIYVEENMKELENRNSCGTRYTNNTHFKNMHNGNVPRKSRIVHFWGAIDVSAAFSPLVYLYAERNTDLFSLC